MTILTKTPDLLPFLKSLEPFSQINEDTLKWLIHQSELRAYDKGELLFKPDDPVNEMLIIVEGEYVIEFEQQGKRRNFGTITVGEISGLLPFSRLKTAKGFGTATQPSQVLHFHKKHFTDLVVKSYDLAQALVGLMSDRVRSFSIKRSQDEKLMALGKLSAGLAHELNNPASAMVRSAQELHNKLHQTPEKFKRLMKMNADDEMVDGVNNILFAKLDKGIDNDLSTLDRNDLEDDLTDWLEDLGIEETEDMVETFTDYNLSTESLDEVMEIVGRDNQPEGVLGWMENVLSTEKLICEIKESSDRIAKLVKSVKGYSHMDKEPVREDINVKDGIISTIIMLKHKIKQKQINLEKTFDDSLPKINAFGGEINQVWTNIIDNALDALPQGGTLKIKTYLSGRNLCVDINDNGHGIPEEVITRIFDPFYTTKGMNEGTGMGLDIVKKIMTRHSGDIQVESEPGNTTFTVCFPV